MINDLLVERAEKTTLQPAVPIKPKGLPIRAVKEWKNSNGSLEKEFKLSDIETRNRFMIRLLSYEEEKGHSAKILIDENVVKISVSTRDLKKVTELDKEYTRDVDMIYKELQND